MDIHSSKQIAGFNRFFEPNPFNTGPPILPPALTPLFEFGVVESKVDSEISTPGLSSSPTSTAPSSPQSSRSALSLDDPEIRKIWENPQFGPVVHNGTPFELNSFTSATPFKVEEYTLLNTCPFLNDDFGSRDLFLPAGTLNPLAQPFVPCFAVQDIQHSIGIDQISTFYDDSTLFSPLNFRVGQYESLDSSVYLRTVEESVMYPVHPSSQYTMQFDSAQVGCEGGPLDPPYPPGLPHPRHAGKRHPLVDRSAGCHDPLPPAYSTPLVEAFIPTLDNSTRDSLLRTVFDRMERWDLFTLRELTSALMVAGLGNEHDLVLPCSEKACPDHRDESIELDNSGFTSPEEVFYQVVAGFAKMILQNLGQSFVDTFLLQVIDSIFSRFILYFDSNKPDSLNLYYKTHQVPPCTSYIRSAFSLCKTIAFLYQQSIVQRIDVVRCITLLLQDLMSVEHLEAVRFIILGSGIKLWDPPLSMLSTSVVDVEGADGTPASPSNFVLPPIKQQAKAKLCRDITMFCSKLDGYKIKRGQCGCDSLRDGQKWNLSGESYRAVIKEITDDVHEWETELVKLIDQREELVLTSQSQELD